MSARARSLVLLVPTLLAVLAGGAWQARAQAQSQPAPTTTLPLLEDLLSKVLPTTVPPTTAPPPAPPASNPQAPGQPGTRPTTTTTKPPPGVRFIPPEFQQIIGSVRRTGGRSTTALMAALKRLKELGVPDEEIIVKGMGQFPVAGEAVYSDDWFAPRFTPTFHLHEGTDIFAVRGTPVRAPADGTVRFGEEPVGGKAAYVTEPNGTYYYMAHLDAFSPKVRSGSKVGRGQVVGFVGDSGNAQGGSPHLHFEVHPRGGGPINPKPILDGWLDRALADVPRVLAAYEGGVSRALTATSSLSRLEDVAGASEQVARPPDSSLLWASTITPAGGALRLAELEVARAADLIDWDAMSRAGLAEEEARREARALAQSVLAPLTPPGVVLALSSPNTST